VGLRTLEALAGSVIILPEHSRQPFGTGAGKTAVGMPQNYQYTNYETPNPADLNNRTLHDDQFGPR
jgi:hypothetical protein